MKIGNGGFTDPQQKGLFTFYREQSGEGGPIWQYAKEQDNYFSEKIEVLQKPSRLPFLAAHKPKPQPISFIALSPHSVISNDPETFKKRTKREPCNTGEVCRMPTLTLSLNQALQEEGNAVQYSFELTTQRREKQISHKGRAKTEANPKNPHGLSSPLKQRKQHHRYTKQPSNEYFSMRADPLKAKEEPKTRPKKKVHRLSTVEEGRQQNNQLIISRWSSKPAVKPMQLLPQVQEEGASISFWEYFQERKNLLLGKYKRERAGMQKGFQNKGKGRVKAALTNNHI